ncbi:lipopolysaccharide-induced tumor necrosis factor-alpha factor homolog isoform X2 [Cynoglossus semilaevis]|uniref:lipopolysaccharide-induced tumor necrosis factor-alpha factor homolog isoform X2 n=1 Tax=Cynoglossus semilaevis TaxID=244447 RepID=UPI0007DC8413|nr:lipopolysaccharide-induced tumor necrosis factor-alpha factor homolog isoform X2 [Cynoglossus semilaevis]
MEKGYPPHESAPPYPGPPMNYGAAAPPPGHAPLPGYGPSVPSSGYPPPPGYGPAPPLSGYAPPPNFAQGPSPGTTVPTTTVTYVVTPNLQDAPGQSLCPRCNRTVLTRTEHVSGLMAWLICGGLCLFGCFPCACIPFCVDACKDVEHRCSSCNQVLYIYKRM